LIEEGEVEFDDDAWGGISAEAKDLISSIFTEEGSRLSAKKVLSHPWLKKFAGGMVHGQMLDTQIQRLKDFQSKSRFKKAILSFLSTRVSDEDVIKEKQLFEMIDKNKDGYITVKELQEVSKNTHSEVDIKNILMSIDMDKNGAINYSEFIAATMNELITKDAAKVEQAFKFFDKDNNGVIDKSDLKRILESNDDISIDEAVLDEVVKE
jgi:calcium-dependent protein kinase